MKLPNSIRQVSFLAVAVSALIATLWFVFPPTSAKIVQAQSETIRTRTQISNPAAGAPETIQAETSSETGKSEDPKPGEEAGPVRLGTTVNVTTTAQLISEINNCNGQVAPYNGANTIVLADGNFDVSTINNFWYGPTGLPPIRSDITIRNNGNGATIRRTGASNYRLFYIASGNTSTGPAGAGTLTLINVTVSNGFARGGDGGALSGGGGGFGAGGAIYNQGTLNLYRVTLSGNTARGGDGGSDDGLSVESAGGGGMGGNGASATAGGGGVFSRSGGGGGMGGNGGVLTGTSTGGSGGGGISQTTLPGDTAVNGGSPTSTTTGGVGGGSGGNGGNGGAGGASGNLGGGGGGNGSSSTVAGGSGGIGGGAGGGNTDSQGGFGGGGGNCVANSRGGFGAGSGSGGSNPTGDLGFGGGGGGAVASGSQPGGFGGGDSTANSFSGGGGAGMGGAIFNDAGTVNAFNVTVFGNGAQGGNGGAAFSTGGAGGGAAFGGGIFNRSGSLTLTQVTISGNTVVGGTGTVGSTTADNGSADGGALYHLGINLGVVSRTSTSASSTASLTLGNSVLANSNTGNDLVLHNFTTNVGNATVNLTRSGANRVETSTSIGTISSSGPTFSTGDPQISASLALNGAPTGSPQTLFPTSGTSPILNTGTNSLVFLPAFAVTAGVTLSDQRGSNFSRITGTSGSPNVDLGAVEVQFAPLVQISAPTLSTVCTSSNPTVDYTVTYVGAITINHSTTTNATGGATATVNSTGSGSTRTVSFTTISVPTSGTLGFTVPAGAGTNNANNAADAAVTGSSVNTSAATNSTTFTVSAPVGVSVSGPTPTIVCPGGSVSFTVTYTNAAAITLSAGNVSLVGGGTGTVGVSGSGNTRTVTVTGVGGSGTLGLAIAAGTATNGACTASGAASSSSATVGTSPTAFAVTGGGSFCSGGSGVAVGLSGSQTGVNYQLFLAASPVGSPVAGTGAAISFGNQTTPGTYTVVATNATTGCTANMTGSATVNVNPTPTLFNVTGGGAFCATGPGVAVGLSGSQTGVNYQLFNGASPVGSPVAGTGAALNFGNQTTAGTYTVVATNTTTSCTANMTGSAVVTVNPTPTAFNVTGGGSFCSGGSGVAVGLSGSQTGVNYQLFNGASPVGSPVVGTGSALNFGNQTAAGTYTVGATNTTTGCSASMTGNAVVTVNPTPTAFNVTGGGSFCATGPGVAVGLSGSQTGVNYQLFNGASPVGSPVAGTGSALNFGNQTTAGTYTVGATNTTTGCSASMTGNAVVTVNPTPTAFNVTGGGSFCSGGSGVAVGLSGSQTGVNYQLFNGASPVGSPVAGTGSALNFGNQTTAGTYTVGATNTTTGCSASMTGNAVVTVNPTPTAFNVTGGGSFCSGGTGVAVGLSGSQTGVNYQLFNGASPVGSPVVGTGSALNFGNQTAAGTYTVGATNTTTGCSASMTGNAVVTVNPTPTAFNVTGGGSFCSGGTGVAVGLSGSQTGVNYQLFNGASPVGSPVAGTGSALNFGNQTTAGTYTVVATNATTSCTANMTGSAVVTVNPTPTAFNVTGSGSFCSGGTGVAVGLDGSQTGVNYQLFNGASPVGSPVAGTGSAISFGNQTAAGTYTVVATDATTGCSANMTGSATVTVISCGPTVTTNPATGVSPTSATLNGTVNANGDNTTVLFRYGTTAGGPYPNSMAATPSPVTGTTPTAISANITGLSSGVTYFFIAEGTNTFGTVQGGEQSFTTGACSYALSAPSASFPAAGGNGSVTLTTNPGCTWSVSGIPTWILNLTPSSGTGTTLITYSVTPNLSETSRSAILTIGGQSYTVNQDPSVPVNSSINFAVVSQTVNPPTCSPSYSNDYVITASVTNTGSQTIYNPFFTVLELQEAAGSPPPAVPFRLLTADGATCSTGGLVGSIQSTDGQTTPATLPTLAPGQSVTVRFVIALPSLRRFRAIFGVDGSFTAPIASLKKGRQINSAPTFTMAAQPRNLGGMSFLFIPTKDGKQLEAIPVQSDLESFLNLGDDFWVGLNRTLQAQGRQLNR